MPLFALPLALFALCALPALAAVYFLRSRHQRREVSSLLLWPKEALPKGGGRKASPFRSSLLLLLELLILILLALAAAGPVVGAAGGRRMVCVVLDDSVSMRAHDGAGDSARARAKKALLEEMEKLGRFEAQVLVAGPRPRVAGTVASNEALAQLLGDPDAPQSHWACLSEAGDIQAALALVGQMAPPGAVTLVLSDHGAPVDLPAGARFISVGQPLPNIGITAAARSGGAVGDADGRLLLEISNFSSASTTTPVVIEAQDGRGGWLQVASAPAQVPAGGRATLTFKTGLEQTLRARLDFRDALDEDNQVTLLPEPKRVLPVKVAVANKSLRQSLERALQAVGMPQVSVGEHLLITDGAVPVASEATPPRANVWEWRITTGDDKRQAESDPETTTQAEPGPEQPKPAVRAFTGPYILNHTHPLTRGLSLEGVVWGLPVPGLVAQPEDEEIIGLGDRPLLLDRLFPSGAHRLQSALVPDISTLTQTPAFPVLLSNLVDWRLDHEPGLRRTNWRQGESVRIAVPAEGGTDVPPVSHDAIQTHGQDARATWELTSPDGQTMPWHGGGPIMEVPAPAAGLYTFAKKDGPAFPFRVNLCNANVSDLRSCATKQAGAWPETVVLEGRFKVAFLLVLLALALLALHGHLARKGMEG